ncbi:MAG TPA: CBASS oligonucleotide cyclase [Pyrinomonadaceae bacterium]|jgi:hypothetical protein
MGSSGGGSYVGKVDASKLFQKLRDSQDETSQQQFDSDVASLFVSLLSQFNDRDVPTINEHLEEIKEALSEDIEGTVDLRFGGSVAKHTYVDGLSDIDALVLLDKSELKDKTPEQVKDYFFKTLKAHFKGVPIIEGRLAITLAFPDAEIQLLPAVRHRAGFQIADPTGTKWSYIRPRKFTSALTKVNQEMSGKVVPTIKLAKSIIDDLPKERRLTGYHVEALALAVFKDYDGPRTPRAMLTHFFRTAPQHILQPLADPTGQSKHVDAYLGNANSLPRQIAADSVGRIGRRMQSANDGLLLDEWRGIVGAPEGGQ